MTSFFEQGFKLLLVAWPEGIALFIGAFFVFAQGITTAHEHLPVVPLWRHYNRQGSGFNSPWRGFEKPRVRAGPLQRSPTASRA